MKKNTLLIASLLLAGSVFAKLPVPVLSDEAKAKAAEAAAKTAHGNKVADYQLCLSREKTAAHYFKTAKAAGKEIKPATDTPACADPGAFVFSPPAAPTAPIVASATTSAPAAVAAAPATTAAASTTPVKK